MADWTAADDARRATWGQAGALFRSGSGWRGQLSLGVLGEIRLWAFPDDRNPDRLNLTVDLALTPFGSPRVRVGKPPPEHRTRHAGPDPECPVGRERGNHPLTAFGCTCAAPAPAAAPPDDDDIPF